VCLGDSLVEGLALAGREIELLRARLAGTVTALIVSLASCSRVLLYCCLTYGEGTSAPWAATADLTQVCEDVEGGLVAERDVDEAVVRQSGHGGDGRALLPTTLGASGDEEAGVLAPEGTSLPLATSLVPEGLELSREVACPGIRIILACLC